MGVPTIRDETGLSASCEGSFKSSTISLLGDVLGTPFRTTRDATALADPRRNLHRRLILREGAAAAGMAERCIEDPKSQGNQCRGRKP